ncbi:MAG: tail fiber domain-containing protein [Candidatus Pacebacteria bacterium]|nr:tail fiber domain-containing protein [Candidatus Paceibacterota bacterium]
MRKFSILLVFVYVTVFSLYNFVIAANPSSPFAPGENVQDPGDPLSSWGGCGPLDSNCYVTFAMPSSAIPTVDSDGEIAYDTTVADFSTGVIRFYGTEEQGIISLPIAEFTAPSDGDLVSYNATTDEFELVTAAGIPTDSLDYDDFEDTMDLDAALTLNQGTNTWTQNFTGTTTTGMSYVANSLTTGTALSISSSSLTWIGALVNLSSTSTAATGNLQKVLNVSTSGANANASQTTYGGYFSNTHTGSGFTQNRAVYATSSGGTANTAVYAVASGGTTATGLYATASGATNNYAAHIDGILALGSGNSFLIQSYSDVSLSLGAGTPPSVLYSLFFGGSAGSSATNASYSNFLGRNAGNGATNASNSNFLGDSAGYGATNADDSNFFGIQAGYQVTAVDDANFFGASAGYQATSAADSNFFGLHAGYLATNASSSNFFGTNAGSEATDATSSIFIGSSAGIQATSATYGVFLGAEAGGYANAAANSVFIGTGAGYVGFGGSNSSNSVFLGNLAGWKASGTSNAANSIFIGQNSGVNDAVDNTTGGYSILLGPDTDTGNFSNSIAMGRGATNTASNQLIFGSDDTNSSISSVFFGTGVTATSPVGVVINGSGASGTDIAGASLTFAGGKATGNAVGGSIVFQTSDAGASGATLQSLTTKMTLLPSGFFGINDTTPDYRLDIETDVASYVANFFNDGNATTRSGILIQGGLDDSTAAGPSTLIGFQDGDGGAIGSITFGSSATAYNTTSDQRLKNMVNERTNSSLDLLNQIQIHDFTWKNDTNDNIYTGVYAQELYDIYPHAVTKPVNPNDNWMVDYSKLTPVVVASIQDLDIKLKDISDFEAENNSFGEKLRNWFGNVSNGIEDLYANVVHSKKAVVETICVGTEEDNTCITKDKLDELLFKYDISNTKHDETSDVIVTTGDEKEVVPNEETPEEPIVEEIIQEETVYEPVIEEISETSTEEPTEPVIP